MINKQLYVVATMTLFVVLLMCGYVAGRPENVGENSEISDVGHQDYDAQEAVDAIARSLQDDSSSDDCDTSKNPVTHLKIDSSETNSAKPAVILDSMVLSAPITEVPKFTEAGNPTQTASGTYYPNIPLRDSHSENAARYYNNKNVVLPFSASENTSVSTLSNIFPSILLNSLNNLLHTSKTDSHSTSSSQSEFSHSQLKSFLNRIQSEQGAQLSQNTPLTYGSQSNQQGHSFNVFGKPSVINQQDNSIWRLITDFIHQKDNPASNFFDSLSTDQKNSLFNFLSSNQLSSNGLSISHLINFLQPSRNGQASAALDTHEWGKERYPQWQSKHHSTSQSGIQLNKEFLLRPFINNALLLSQNKPQTRPILPSTFSSSSTKLPHVQSLNHSFTSNISVSLPSNQGLDTTLSNLLSGALTLNTHLNHGTNNPFSGESKSDNSQITKEILSTNNSSFSLRNLISLLLKLLSQRSTNGQSDNGSESSVLVESTTSDSIENTSNNFFHTTEAVSSTNSLSSVSLNKLISLVLKLLSQRSDNDQSNNTTDNPASVESTTSDSTVTTTSSHRPDDLLIKVISLLLKLIYHRPPNTQPNHGSDNPALVESTTSHFIENPSSSINTHLNDVHSLLLNKHFSVLLKLLFNKMHSTESNIALDNPNSIVNIFPPPLVNNSFHIEETPAQNNPTYSNSPSVITSSPCENYRRDSIPISYQVSLRKLFCVSISALTNISNAKADSQKPNDSYESILAKLILSDIPLIPLLDRSSFASSNIFSRYLYNSDPTAKTNQSVDAPLDSESSQLNLALAPILDDFIFVLINHPLFSTTIDQFSISENDNMYRSFLDSLVHDLNDFKYGNNKLFSTVVSYLVKCFQNLLTMVQLYKKNQSAQTTTYEARHTITPPQLFWTANGEGSSSSGGSSSDAGFTNRGLYGLERGELDEHSEQKYDVEHRIIGGLRAADGEIPYQVALYKMDVFVCGSSVITPYYVITAGHCINGIRPHQLWIRVGSIDLTRGGETYEIAKTILHEKYSNSDYDIALIKTARKIKFGNKVRPITLPARNTPEVAPGTPVRISGWGLTDYSPKVQTYYLHKLELKIASRERCRNRIMSSSRPITKRHICTSSPVNAGTCFGDSGGPLVAYGVLVGIVSWGSPCAIGDPDVYTNVLEFLPWIYSHMDNFGDSFMDISEENIKYQPSVLNDLRGVLAQTILRWIQ